MYPRGPESARGQEVVRAANGDRTHPRVKKNGCRCQPAVPWVWISRPGASSAIKASTAIRSTAGRRERLRQRGTGNLVLAAASGHSDRRRPGHRHVRLQQPGPAQRRQRRQLLVRATVPAQLAVSGARASTTTGSSITIILFDGSQQVYTWDGTRYTSAAGGGAYDTVTSAAGQYTRVAGLRSRRKSTAASSGKLLSRTGRRRQHDHLRLPGNLLTSVPMATRSAARRTPESLLRLQTPTNQLTAIPADNLVDANGSCTGNDHDRHSSPTPTTAPARTRAAVRDGRPVAGGRLDERRQTTTAPRSLYVGTTNTSRR